MEKAEIKTIYVIESLPVCELKSGTELFNDIISRYLLFHGNQDKVNIQLFEPTSSQEFLVILDNILVNIKDIKSGLLLHIEAHGADDRKGLILADNSFVSWDDLNERFRQINWELKNDLYISMATCFGRHLHETISIRKIAPFRAFISASRGVSVNEILESYIPLFMKLSENLDLVQSFVELQNTEDTFYYKDCRKVWEKAIISTFDKLRSDPDTIKSFMKNVKDDYETVGLTENMPPFEEISGSTESLMELVKLDIIKSTKRNFFFGKGEI